MSTETREGAASASVLAAYSRIREHDRPEVWIALRPEDAVLADAELVDAALARGERLPLAGLTVAVKDNVDVAGLPTTAGCPAFAYAAESSAPAVERLEAAGAVVLGKTNMDQFATGLAGTRSPYGAVRSAWAPDRVAGGSSSGSAVAVALGLADLGVATDTAGSGRVPAAFNGVVGYKPTPGRIPTAGVVPASRSYDCVGVFARSIAAAELAAGVLAGEDGALPADAPRGAPPAPVVAAPSLGRLGALGDGYREAFAAVLDGLAAAGARIVEVDLSPFLEGGELLYGGALVAERYEAFGRFLEEHPEAVDPSVRAIVGAARDVPAHLLVRDRARLERLRARALRALGGADALVLPTAPEHPTLAAVAADPIGANARLGRFTSFANPFGLCAVAAPAGTAAGRPFGVTVFARAFHDRVAADVAALVAGEPAPPPGEGCLLFALGAHMLGQPLNHELTSRGARFVGPAATLPHYRLFALPTSPPKPGLVPAGGGGASVAGELWLLPPAALGALLAALPEPLVLGPIELADGTAATGFYCHSTATGGALEITSFGGWRAYLEATAGAEAAWT